jgi:hypothetical protein
MVDQTQASAHALEGHRVRARELIEKLLADRRSLMHVAPPEGTLRGIDYYSRRGLVTLMTNVMARYERKCGVPLSYPEQATLLSEKITWSKFFRPLPVPTLADKLNAFSMLPAHATRNLKRAEVVWQSSEPQMPANSAVEPGEYFLKPNHASGMFELISFPLHDSSRVLLEAKCAGWLQTKFGRDTGEWWYSTIAPRVFLEKALDLGQDHPAEFKFHVVKGTAVSLHIYRRGPQGETSSIYDGNLRFCDISYQGMPNPRHVLPDRAPELLAIAERLAQGLDYVRVDLYLDRKAEVSFGELTFAPSDGRGTYSSPAFEARICRDWDIRRYLYV